MAGYYKNPEATARAIDADGWLHTGDLARRRDDGNYRIVGRSKELIIRGGENIYPARGRGVPPPSPRRRRGRRGRPARRQVRRGRRRLDRPPAGAVAVARRRSRAYCQGPDRPLQDPPAHRHRAALPRTVTGKVRKHVLKEQAIAELGLGDVAADPDGVRTEGYLTASPGVPPVRSRPVSPGQ